MNRPSTILAVAGFLLAASPNTPQSSPPVARRDEMEAMGRRLAEQLCGVR